MTQRDLAYPITPTHDNGYTAPSIMITARSYAEARREAMKKSTLSARFKNWSLK